MNSYLEQFLGEYRECESVDIIKLLFQAAFGPGHIIGEGSLAYLEGELEGVEADSTCPLYRRLSPYYLAVDLRAWKALSLSSRALYTLMTEAPKTLNEDSTTLFISSLRESEALLGAKWREYYKAYLELGIRPVHHSARFNELYKPHYRVVPSSAFYALEILNFGIKRGEVITLEGMAASGKSTTAALLSSALGLSVIRMDDFFLPPERKTRERLSTIGGNIDSERFSLEVVDALKRGGDLSYSVYDCSSNSLVEKRRINRESGIIVEGVYSMHPSFGHYYSSSFFFKLDKREQERRLEARSPYLLERFKGEWLPLEEQYFKALSIAERADRVLFGS